MNDSISTNKSKLEQSLFEIGKNLSKSITFLMVVALTLAIAVTSDNDIIKVPIIGLELPRYKGLNIILFLYIVAYYRYVVLTNHQKYIFNNLAQFENDRNPWESLNPTVYNAIFYYDFKNNQEKSHLNLFFIAIVSFIIGTAIPVYTFFAVYKESNILWLIPSFFMFVYSMIHSYGYIKSRIK